MPIYRYRCPACGQIDEVFAKISDPPPAACSVCGGAPMEKAVSRTSFALKGGGWYAEGYESGGKKAGASAAASDSTPKKAEASTPASTPAAAASSAASSSSSSD